MRSGGQGQGIAADHERIRHPVDSLQQLPHPRTATAVQALCGPPQWSAVRHQVEEPSLGEREAIVFTQPQPIGASHQNLLSAPDTVHTLEEWPFRTAQTTGRFPSVITCIRCGGNPPNTLPKSPSPVATGCAVGRRGEKRHRTRRSANRGQHPVVAGIQAVPNAPLGKRSGPRRRGGRSPPDSCGRHLRWGSGGVARPK